MKVFRKDGQYVVQCKFEERHLPRKAGFTFDPRLKRWITSCDDTARQLYNYTIGSARQRLDNIEAVKQAAIDASYAEDTDSSFPAPEGLNYLPYQKAGIEYALSRQDVLIADQPGLGKTIQFIGVTNALPKRERILVVCPASLKLNWRREFEKWTVHGYSVGIAETKPRQKKQEDGSTKRWTEALWPETEVVIVNYDLLPHFHDQIRERSWDFLCCDESHRLQTATTIRTRHVLGGGRGKKRVERIEADRRIFLTGTPITSKPINLWTTVSAFDPDGLGKSFKKYAYRYCDAVTTPFGLDTSGASNLEELRRLLRQTFMIRRKKKDVLKDLPDKRRQVIELPADGLRKVVKKELQVFEDNIARLAAFNDGEEYRPEEALADLTDDEIVDLMSDLCTRHKITGDWKHDARNLDEAFAYHFEAMSLVREETAMAKVPMAREYIDRILDSGEKAIVFVVHKAVADELRQHYDGCAFVTGAVPKKRRQAEVDRFQEDDDCRVMIGNIAAAGEGFTMTTATHVVFVELTWTPAEMEQAEDRAHRIGQKNAVNIHFLVVEGSLEARIIEILIEKMEVIEEALDGKSCDTRRK